MAEGTNDQQSERRFSRALRDALMERELALTPAGNVNLIEFAKLLPTVHYETLRKAVSDERRVSPAVMEEVAEALGVEPTYFVEYRLHLAQQQFDVRQVGWEKAMENLAAFAEAHTERKRPRRVK